ncbi:hypothetical protein MAPG_01684 [Magnaporthiopsis poae ATCC 64411]|uniref:Rhodopsin domain-containing protein n=1 Tax=Magnaporthiopsis poae (strain ATCC 64411 / 73-15) TaxID=644358 RepID=A0A0C4DPC2_MAGP6|nr:hypothetical protein MAPG_01684 [Magnaporthiopsis poae ATCC 64411]
MPTLMYPGQDLGPALVGVQGAMLLLSVIAVAARVYTSAILIKLFRFEDGLAVVTLLAFTALTLFGCLGVSYGMGRRVVDVAPDQRITALFYKYLCMSSYVAVSGLIKFVVGIYLIRLFRNSRKKWQSWTLIVLLVVVGIANIFYFFVAIFQCYPIWFFWRRYDPDFKDYGKCFPPPMALGSTYTVNIVNIVADLALALMPISLVWNAKLDRRTKFSVVGILALGSASSLVTIIRVPYQKQLLHNPEYLGSFIELGNWSSVEIGLAIIASSAATLRPLFRKFKLLAAEVRSNGTNSSRVDRGGGGGGGGARPKPKAGLMEESFAGTTLQGSDLHSRTKSQDFGFGDKKKVVDTLASFSEYSPTDSHPGDGSAIKVDIEECAGSGAGAAPSPGSNVIVFDPAAYSPAGAGNFFRDSSQEELRNDVELQPAAAAPREPRRPSKSKSPEEALADLESAHERRFSIVQPVVDPTGGATDTMRRPSFPRRESSVRSSPQTVDTVELPLLTRSPQSLFKSPRTPPSEWPLSNPPSPPRIPSLARLSSILSHRSLEEDCEP